MRFRLLLFPALLGLLLTFAAPAQGQSTEPELIARLVDKPLILRGFWGDDKLKFDEKGQPRGQYHPVSFTICGMDVTKVKLSGNSIRLEGQRVGLAFEKDGKLRRLPLITGDPRRRDPEKITLEIDARGSRDFGPALDAIFATDLDSLVSLLPPIWQDYGRKHFQPGGTGSDVVGGESASRPKVPLPEKLGVSHVGGGVKPPRVLHMAEPEFSEEARVLKYSGTVMVYLWVDEEGTPSHVQVARPAGMGLDEEAIKAVSSYTFVPAVKDGKAVKVDLYVDVNFQIF